MASNIREKTIKGVGWSAIDNISSHAVSFFVGIILARILSPEDYGLLGLIGIFIAISDTFINAGFTNALIRKKDATEEDYNTVFVSNLFMSLLMYGILFVCAPLIADFFERQELVNLTRILSIGLIITAFSLVQRTRVTKRIDFKTQTKITLINSIISGVIGIIAAYKGLGVWALVIQRLIAQAISTTLYIFYNKWIPKLRFSVNSFKELFGFGSKLLLSSLLNTVWGQINSIVIGKIYSPAILGQTSRAGQFSSLFSSNINNIVQRVSFPVLSEMQDDKDKLKRGYQKIITTTMLVTFSCMLMLAAISKPMVIALIGTKWIQASYFLQIICWGSMLYPLHSINLNMLQVQGRSNLFLNLEIIKKVILIGPILLGIFVGIYWMLIGNVIYGFVCYYLNSYYSGKFLNYSMKEQVMDILPCFMIALIASLIAYTPSLIYDVAFPDQEWELAAYILLPIQILLGGTVLIFLHEKKQIEEYVELKNIAKSGFEKVKNQFINK